MSQQVQTHYGPGLCSMLTVLFVALKLTGYVSWSWGWVLAPLWLPLIAVTVLGISIVVIATLVRWWGGRY